MIAANHLSYLDPPLIGVSCSEEVNYFARASLFRNRLFGYCISKLNAHPVKGDADDFGTFKLILKCLKEQKKVIIFPEGSRSEDGKLAELKSGFAMLALKARCPILPTYVIGTYEIWSIHRKVPKLFGHTVCIFGSPIEVSSFDHLPKKEAQAAIKEATQAALENLKRWYEAGAIGPPP